MRNGFQDILETSIIFKWQMKNIFNISNAYHQNMKLDNPDLVLHSNPQLVHLREVQLDEVDRIFNLKKRCWLIIFLQILIALNMNKI